jgi:hypothetical protein
MCLFSPCNSHQLEKQDALYKEAQGQAMFATVPLSPPVRLQPTYGTDAYKLEKHTI